MAVASGGVVELAPQRGQPPRWSWTPRAGRAPSQQEEALNRLRDLVKVFVDDKPEKGGVPRTPRWDWEPEPGKLRVSYTGEVVEKAQALTYEQILPGLQTLHHGGLLGNLEVVDEKLKRLLERPDLLLRKVVEQVPKRNVMCSDMEVAQGSKSPLRQAPIVVPVNTRPVVRGMTSLQLFTRFTWPQYLVLRKPVPWSVFEPMIGLAVLPMS